MKATEQPEWQKGCYVHFDDMTWPSPKGIALAEVGWRLRYGAPTQTDRYIAASVIEAYSALLSLPQRDRNARVRSIRKAEAE